MTIPVDAAGLTVVSRRVIRASAQRLFDAWTMPDQLIRWWGPPPVKCVGAEIDLREGGRYRIGNAFPDGRVLWIVGEFERVIAPHELVYSWQIERADATAERVSVSFVACGESTEVIVVHEHVADASIRASHERGWQACLQRLADAYDVSVR